MDLKEKVIDALRDSVELEYIRIEDEDGIWGVIVSPHFRRMSALDRQTLIDRALRDSPGRLAPEELDRVRFIATLTPAEFEAVGVKTRVQRVRELAGGAVEITVYGRPSDAEHVRKLVSSQNGVSTSEPTVLPGAAETARRFRAKGSRDAPLTKAKVLAALRRDASIEIMPNA